jgi:hypothetical protein
MMRLVIAVAVLALAAACTKAEQQGAQQADTTHMMGDTSKMMSDTGGMMAGDTAQQM